MGNIQHKHKENLIKSNVESQRQTENLERREKLHIVCRTTTIQLKTNISSEIMEARREQNVLSPKIKKKKKKNPVNPEY